MAPRRLHEQAKVRAVAEATGRPCLAVAGLLLALQDADGVEAADGPVESLIACLGADGAFWRACLENGLVLLDGTRAIAALPRGKTPWRPTRQRQLARDRQRARRARLAGVAPPPPPAEPEPPAPPAEPEPAELPAGPGLDLFGTPIVVEEPRPATSREPHPLFARFWQGYPLKKARIAAVRAFNRIDPNPGELDLMLAAIERHKLTDGWKRGYVPHAATWLNGRRWEDDAAGNPLGRHSRVEAEPSPYESAARQVQI